MSATFLEDSEIEDSFNDIEELKDVLTRIKCIEKEAEDVISKVENGKDLKI